MRVAIPESEGHVERVADSATTLMVIEIHEGKRANYFETPLRNRSMRDRARELAAMKIDVLLVNEISHALESLVKAFGIEVLQKQTGNVDEVIERFVDHDRSSGKPSEHRSLQLDVAT